MLRTSASCAGHPGLGYLQLMPRVNGRLSGWFIQGRGLVRTNYMCLAHPHQLASLGHLLKGQADDSHISGRVEAHARDARHKIAEGEPSAPGLFLRPRPMGKSNTDLAARTPAGSSGQVRLASNARPRAARQVA